MSMDARHIAEYKSTLDHFSKSRSSRISSGAQEFFQLNDKWLGHHDEASEKVTYSSLDPEQLITEVEYDGSGRYQEDKPGETGFRIVLHVRNLKKLVKLARLLEYSKFIQICRLDPLRLFSEETVLGINFSENLIQENAHYIDELFEIIGQVETLPIPLLSDLKCVIAYNCVEKFKKKLRQQGFDAALKLLKSTFLKGVFSPFYVAALHCRETKKFRDARELIKQLPKSHRQYEEGRLLERLIYEQEIKLLEVELEQVKKAHARDKLNQAATEKPSTAHLLEHAHLMNILTSKTPTQTLHLTFSQKYQSGSQNNKNSEKTTPSSSPTITRDGRQTKNR